MVTITGKYLGNKKVAIIHGPSGVVINTAAPKDNQGDGSSFSPTDLATASLASCMVTTMGIVAERDGLDISGTHFVIEKHMGTNPRRIARLPLTIHMPRALSDDARKKMENTAKTCPVHRSLHPDVVVELTFVFDL